MLLNAENWPKGYSQILADCRPQNLFSGNSGSVLILCNPDADSLCAARIFSYILRADNIPYQLRPCGGVRKLISILESLNLNSSSSVDHPSMYNDDGSRGEDDIDEYGNPFDENTTKNQSNNVSNSAVRAIVLLNLGATMNLDTLLYSPRPIVANKNSRLSDDDEEDDDMNMGKTNPPLISHEIKTFVLDSHRPYHLANVHAGKNIVIWNDFDHWHHDDGGIPSDGDGLSGDEDDDSEEEDSEDEDDSDEESSEEEDSDEGEAEFEDEDDPHPNDENSVEEENGNPAGSLKRAASEGDSDAGDENESSISRTKRQRQEDPDTPDTDNTLTDDEEVDPELSDEIETNSSSRTGIDAIQSMREQHKNRRDRIQRYYRNGSFYSSPVSYMVYMLSTNMRHTSVGDLLWLACIGVTDAYIHNRLELSGYIRLSVVLQGKVKDAYPDSDFRFSDGDNNDHHMQRVNQRMNNTCYAEELYSSNNNGDFEDDDTNRRLSGPMTQIGFSENGRILIQKDEFRFFLLRHISLWDAMVLSSEVNTKMELWKSSGMRKLREMMAKMGLPLTQCQQRYAFMKPALKRRLRLMIMEHAEEYGLDNLSYTGFIRVTGYKSLLSASDVAYAVTALLECESKHSHDQNVHKGGEDGVEGQNSLIAEEEEEMALVTSFNTAYDALNSNGTSSNGTSSSRLGASMGGGEGSDLSSIVNGGDSGGSTSGIGAGVRLAVTLQTAIVTTAMGLVERKAITRLSHFRYAYLHATSQGANGGTSFQSTNTPANNKRATQNYNHHVFAKPLALTKLALFLMDMHRTNKKWTGTKSRPLILLSEKPQTQTYLVVGYEFPEERGSLKKNKFKQVFKLATETLKGSFKYDSFESNVVEVSSGEVQKFIEHLHYTMDST